MADVSNASGTAPVTDKRPVPTGVLPRRVQTWIMAALAMGMLLIILVTGQPEPSRSPTAPAASTSATDPDRVRDFQDRLRLLDSYAAREAQAAAGQTGPLPPSFENDGGPQVVDPLVADRQRREYESLFASNVVLSRRAESQRPDAGVSAQDRGFQPDALGTTGLASIDEIADAVVRASTRAGVAPNVPMAPTSEAGAASQSSGDLRRPDGGSVPAAATGPISAAGPLHRLMEGIFIETVLTNRLDGTVAAPVNCLVTTPVFSHSGQHVLIPAGTRILGRTRPVQSFGETRLAVSFHRLMLPDGRTYPLDQFMGLNQIGDAGLRDRVNQHYWSTFGAAAAVGVISGLGQLLGTAGLSRGAGDRTVVIAGGATDATAQAAAQTMNRFLNRMPTITIREGHRVRVYLTSDLELPEYSVPGRF